MAAKPSYWLVKTEPETFGWDHQVAHGVEPWTGVRNYTARNNLRAMQRGDLAFFYHSNTGKEIVGVVEVAREAYPDPTATTGDWSCVDMRALAPMPKPVSLAAMKADPALADFALIRLSRLSVVPVSPAHWRHICTLGGYRAPQAKIQPKETRPKETRPKETRPKETGPKETGPKKTGPKKTGPKEIGGPAGPEPTRYGDWEQKGRCTDF